MSFPQVEGVDKDKDKENGEEIERMPIEDLISNRSRRSSFRGSTMSKKDAKKAKKIARRILML